MPKMPTKAKFVPIREWEIVHSGGLYRYVSHDLELASTGCGTEEALKLSADGFRTHAIAVDIMHDRYRTMFKGYIATVQDVYNKAVIILRGKQKDSSGMIEAIRY